MDNDKLSYSEANFGIGEPFKLLQQDKEVEECIERLKTSKMLRLNSSSCGIKQLDILIDRRKKK